MNRRRRPRRVRPIFDYQPRLLELEDRRAPGDMVIGSVLFGAGMGMEFLWPGTATEGMDIAIVSEGVDEYEPESVSEFDAENPPAIQELWVTESDINSQETADDQTPVLESGPQSDFLVTTLDVNPFAVELGLDESPKPPRQGTSDEGDGKLLSKTPDVASGDMIFSPTKDPTVATAQATIDSENGFDGWFPPPPEMERSRRDSPGRTIGVLPWMQRGCNGEEGELVQLPNGLVFVVGIVWGCSDQFGDDIGGNAKVGFLHGNLKLSFTDLESNGLGSAFGHTRYWTNRADFGSSNWNGNGHGTVVSQWPYLLQQDSGSDENLYAIHSGVNAQLFTLADGVYTTDDAYWTQETMVVDTLVRQ